MSKVCPVCNNPVSDEDATCPFCSYRLQGTTQSFQPVALNDGEIVAEPRNEQTSAVLRVIQGPQTELVFQLESDEYSIGRSPQCDVFLNDMTVSRKHASIERVDNGYQIEDANSFNGVWINNESIDRARLKDGDIIQIGAFCLIYQENKEG